jgi:uncharacterized membrane protein
VEAGEPRKPEALFGISFRDPYRAEEFLLALSSLASQGGLVLRDAVAGIGVGAGAGALTAKVVDTGIPDEWVELFKLAVQPFTSTVVALAAEVDLVALNHEVGRFEGAELVHTTLQPGASARLVEALRNAPTRR